MGPRSESPRRIPRAGKGVDCAKRKPSPPALRRRRGSLALGEESAPDREDGSERRVSQPEAAPGDDAEIDPEQDVRRERAAGDEMNRRRAAEEASEQHRAGQ